MKEISWIFKAFCDENVEDITLENMGLTGNNAVELIKEVCNEKTLILNLGCNNLGNSGARWVIQLLKDRNVHTLSLNNTGIDDNGVIDCAKSLCNTNVKNINLDLNLIIEWGPRSKMKCNPVECLLKKHTQNGVADERIQTTVL